MSNNKMYEAFAVLPDGKTVFSFAPHKKWVVAASFQFGDPSEFPPTWLASDWCKSKKEANIALDRLLKIKNKGRKEYPVIETAIIPVKHRLYHR